MASAMGARRTLDTGVSRPRMQVDSLRTDDDQSAPLLAQRLQRVQQNRAGENVARITHARRPRAPASTASAPRLHSVHGRG